MEGEECESTLPPLLKRLWRGATVTRAWLAIMMDSEQLEMARVDAKFKLIELAYEDKGIGDLSPLQESRVRFGGMTLGTVCPACWRCRP